MKNPPAKTYMPILCVVSLFAWHLNAAAGERGDWDIRIGMGVKYDAKYEGSDEMKARVLPLVDITWKDRVFLNPRSGLGVHLYDDHGLTVSVGVGYVFARDESDSDDLRGMGDIDETSAANLIVEYDAGLLKPYVGVSRHLGGSEGTLVKAGVTGLVPFALLTGGMNPQGTGEGGRKGPVLRLGASAAWADGDYTESYFGVNSSQSSNSGYARHNPSSGFKSVDFEVGVIYLFAGNWAVNAHVGYSRLLGNAADSPIVWDDGGFSGALFLSYSF